MTKKNKDKKVKLSDGIKKDTTNNLKKITDISKNKEEDETVLKKKDKTLIWIIIVIIAIFASVLISLRSYQEDTSNLVNTPIMVNYSGYIFEKHGNAWVSKITVEHANKQWIREYTIDFHFNPYQVENITTVRNNNGDAVSKLIFRRAIQTYVTMEPLYPASVVLGGVEVAKIIGQVYEKKVKAAVNSPTNLTDAPIITCQNVTNDIAVIELKLSNRTGIFEHQGCVTIEGTNAVEMLRASERLTFEMLDILN
jgi:hypothetical protein